MWVIGDVHGCLKTLMALVDKLKAKNTDRICVAGDLVDRGPDSAGVVQYCMDNKDYIDAVCGSHKRMMLDHYKKQETWQTQGLWFINGGKDVARKYRYKHGHSVLDNVS